MSELPSYPKSESSGLDDQNLPPKRLIGRRAFLLCAGALAAPPIIFGATDTAIGEYYWAGTRPEAHDVYFGEERLDQPKTGVFVLPGFNVANLEHGARAQLPALQQAGDYVGHVTYGNSGFDIRDIYRTVKEKVDDYDIERVRFAAQSMGGMVAFDLAARLYEDDIVTDRILFYSSPFDYAHLHPVSQRFINVLSETDAHKLRLGPITRFGTEFARQIGEEDSIVTAFEDAKQIMGHNGSSNLQLQTSATYIKQFNITKFRDKLPLETQFVYMCASDPRKDTYVDVTKPPTTLQDLILGNSIILTSPDVNHADITVSSRAFCDMTRIGLEQCDTYEYLISLPNPRNAGGI